MRKAPTKKTGLVDPLVSFFGQGARLHKIRFSQSLVALPRGSPASLWAIRGKESATQDGRLSRSFAPFVFLSWVPSLNRFPPEKAS